LSSLQILLDGLTVLTEKYQIVLGAVGIICVGCYIIFHLSGVTSDKRNRSSLLLLFLFFAFSLIIRLAFVTRVYVPPYFDSVEHYRLIRELVGIYGTSDFLDSLTGLTPGYYHLGFHLHASLLTLGLRADPTDVILILGQVTVAAIPVPLFFLLRHETKSVTAAFLGTVLAGFGWYMPGFAVNWGKYPAIAGLLAFEIVLGIAYFGFQKKTYRKRYTIFGALVLGIIISTFIHSRTLIIIALSLACWFLAGRMRTLSRTLQYFSTGMLIAGVLILGTLIQREPLLKLTLEPYLEDGFWITMLVLVLTPFAWIKFSKDFYFSILFILGVFASLYISLNQMLPGYANQTLLDRPFVEMVLYFPVSVLGGLGLAGLLQFIRGMKGIPRKANVYARLLIISSCFGLAAIIPMANYDFYPSDCCNFVKYDDTIAIDWLNRNSPPDARILAASTAMHVLPSGPSASAVGTDAGIWLPNLTGRQIILMPFNLDFRSRDTTEQLCQKRIDYIYVGNTTQSFETTQLREKPDWYRGVLLLPTVQLYQLKDCLTAD